jgi:hypothetical protein
VKGIQSTSLDGYNSDNLQSFLPIFEQNENLLLSTSDIHDLHQQTRDSSAIQQQQQQQQQLQDGGFGKSDKFKSIIISQQRQRRHHNIRTLFVNQFIRTPSNHSYLKLEVIIKELIEKSESLESERNNLITLLLKEAMIYKENNIVQILQNLMK